jgi:hypothetical protein
MINRPSTPRILEDLTTELEREILPLLTDSVAQIRLHMIMTVMRHCAVRSGNETAWMTEESASYVVYAQKVLEATESASVREAIGAIEPFDDLRLPAVIANYSRASEALAVALEASMDADVESLIAEGERLLRMRVTNEQAVTGATEYAGR